MKPRYIIHIDGTYAHPCGCVAEDSPGNVTEACGSRYCPIFPSGVLPPAARIRGQPWP